MQLLKAFYVLVLLFLCAHALTACMPRTVHQNAPATAKEAAQQAIDEANVAIAAAATTLNDAYKAGSVTWAEFSDTRDTLNKAATYRDEAQALLDAGDPTSAQGRLKLADALLNLVQKRLVAIKKGTP